MQCPAVNVTVLKQTGRIVRCGSPVAPSRGLCHIHQARKARAREVLVLDWSDQWWVNRVAVVAADLFQERQSALKAQVEARIAAEVAAISAHLSSLTSP